MSTAKFNTLQNAAGSKSVPVDTVVDGSAKAWVNFNGTGTVAIAAAFNVSSITDNGVGNYTVNFTTAMADANYSMTGTTARPAATTNLVSIFESSGNTRTASAIQIQANQGTTAIDPAVVSVAIFR